MENVWFDKFYLLLNIFHKIEKIFVVVLLINAAMKF